MKYQATDSKGRVHKRNTKASGRTYSHVVVTDGIWAGTDKTWTKAEWRRTKQLAEACARQNAAPGRTVEIIEAKEV